MQLLPRSGREGLARFLKADKVLAEPDKARRAAYEERAAHSEPALEEGAEDEAETETAAAAEVVAPRVRSCGAVAKDVDQ